MWRIFERSVNLLNVKIYTTSTCPKCRVLKMKMDQKGIKYEEIDGASSELLVSKGIAEAPILQVDDGDLMNFSEANKWIVNYKAEER